MIRLRDGLGRVQFLSTTVPRLAAEIPHIAVIHLRDEVALEHFPLKGRPLGYGPGSGVQPSS